MDTVRDFYSGIETGHHLVPRLQLFLDAYRAHRQSLGRPASVLDIGCGREAVMSAHLDPADAYTACDIVPPRVPVSDFTAVNLNNDRLADAFAGRHFDVIFCGELIEHVFSPDDLLEDLLSIMHDGSLLVLSTPNLAYWVNRLLLLVGVSPMFLENSSRQKLGRRFRFLGQGNTTEGHIRVFTHRAMLDLLATQPVRVDRVIPVSVWPNPIDKVVCRFSPSLAPDNVYLLRRAT
jgi:SAM-dependent methyltransferase